ncbi:hypothetical protein ASG04_12245 [Curtobacterium sp. Leaf183]|uniref:hypothetical protein n=1 Tax=Curtobacterium sp. Leaf183 TaxID=1736291 RepID=UPI0006FD7A5F|nr:hypothetical protein [Curtobacterium sp. Leaf183]KQS07930.1 hypothetical protein ASG04_12245 [Curtobacterium sp. Leaf183]
MGNENGSGRRRGGLIGMTVVGAYLVLRFGYLAYREHEDGMSTPAVIGTLVLYAVGLFVIVEIVRGVQNATTRRREAALAQQHPGAHLVPVLLQKDVATDVRRVAAMLNVTLTETVPRRGHATVVADQNGIGIYVGGSTPRLLLGIPRAAIRSVGNGETSAAGRYRFGKVDALRITVDNGQWTTIDLPAYRTVVGFSKHLRDEELTTQVRSVAVAAGVRQDDLQTRPY